MISSGSQIQMSYVATCRFECCVVMDIQFAVTALSAISVGDIIVVVGGVQATSKSNFFICVCVKFEVEFGVLLELLSAPLSYALLLVEYRKRLPFILLMPMDASQWPIFLLQHVILV